MTLKLAEAIRRWMGWCPNAAAAGACRRRYAAPDDEIGLGTAADGSREVVEDVFVEYTSPRFFVLMPFAVLVFLLLFVISVLIPSLWPGLIFTFMAVSLLAWTAWRIYLDPYRTMIEFSGNSVIVRRSHTRPLVFGKDTVRSVEVKRPYLSIPRWLSALLLVLMTAAIFFAGVGNWLMCYFGDQAFNPDFGFQILLAVGWMAFMLELLYRGLVSLRYPGRVWVRLEPAGFLNIYADDPERVAALLGSPQ
ncbi:hypothetical protein SZ63_11435 [Methanoculleus sediminis]|uniref:DUF1673 domain-containing protein n=1 Tax=Methanoculleus sediminis TaxID=1550566 RepID=A0A0H1QW67_9EURY|nr:DUF1673 family protein [Methanoculleus sediminis]KLK87208.1 hypothetical protein SZ63_11435 [Methanoculleus sediminis]